MFRRRRCRIIVFSAALQLVVARHYLFNFQRSVAGVFDSLIKRSLIQPAQTAFLRFEPKFHVRLAFLRNELAFRLSPNDRNQLRTWLPGSDFYRPAISVKRLTVFSSIPTRIRLLADFAKRTQFPSSSPASIKAGEIPSGNHFRPLGSYEEGCFRLMSQARA